MSEPFQPASRWPGHPVDHASPVPLGSSGPTAAAPPTPSEVSAPHAGIADGLAAAAASLSELDGMPVGEHVARLDAVHAILQDALTAIDSV